MRRGEERKGREEMQRGDEERVCLRREERLCLRREGRERRESVSEECSEC